VRPVGPARHIEGGIEAAIQAVLAEASIYDILSIDEIGEARYECAAVTRRTIHIHVHHVDPGPRR